MKARWKTNEAGMGRLLKAGRVEVTGQSLSYVRFLGDFAAIAMNNSWTDIGGVQSRADPKVYVVQSPTTVIERCILMTTDPGDLVLDPTCGSGTTAYVAEQWGGVGSPSTRAALRWRWPGRG
jgi:adenine-specific DNA-methyltransferase